MLRVDSGLLIAIDGIDGAGKTTQCRLLQDYFTSQGHPTVVFKEPTKDGKYAKEIKARSINRVFNEERTPEYELNLFIEDRRENVQKNILPALKDNKIVIIDRYYFSTIAYQSALGIDAKKIKNKNEEFAPIPDATIIIDVPPHVGINRINKRGDKCNSFEKSEYLEKVRDIFLNMEKEKYPNFYIVDGDGESTTHQVLERTLSILEPIIQKKTLKNKEVVCC